MEGGQAIRTMKEGNYQDNESGQLSGIMKVGQLNG